MTTSNNPVLLFDLGNILVKLNRVDRFWEGKQLPPGGRSYQERWIQSEAVRNFETGKIQDLKTFYKRAQAELDIRHTYDEFEQIFIALIGEKFDRTDEILTRLYGRYPLMLLSDTSRPHWQYCRDQLALGRYFEKTYLSYEIGYMKPAPQIYEAVLADIGTIPQNIYYFDDKPENVEMGRKMGMNAQVSWGGDKLAKHLEAKGFL